MKPTSSTILAGIPRRLNPGTQQVLTPAYLELLAKLGNPQNHLPPVFHVAGTNGKGSTCAFLRSILESADYKVHVYTSPHLVHVHERIRIAGFLIGEEELIEILNLCQQHNQDGLVSEFEILTAAAFVAFTRHAADFTILETGLGGRLDATNVVPKPVATLITRLSYDHRNFLGDTLQKIAFEKAGIMRRDVPCFASAQPDNESSQELHDAARKIHAPLFTSGEQWNVRSEGNGFHFEDSTRQFDLPAPALTGSHQFENAGLAIAALSVLKKQLPQSVIVQGLKNVQWPARLQPLKTGKLARILAPNQQLWLDGGHNDSAGEVLAKQAAQWAKDDGANPRPLVLIYGMLTTKNPQEFLKYLVPYIAAVQTVKIPDEEVSFSADDLAQKVLASGVENVEAASSVITAIKALGKISPRARILICGSLYLAGYVLKQNEENNF